MLAGKRSERGADRPGIDVKSLGWPGKPATHSIPGVFVESRTPLL
jgi:hypothetical protein